MASEESEALKRAQRLLNEKSDVSRSRPQSSSVNKPNVFKDSLDTAKAFNENVGWLRRTSNQIHGLLLKVMGVLEVVWSYSGPIRLIVGPVFRFIVRNYMRFFRWGAYRTIEDSESGIFSKKRATVVIVFTLLGLVTIWYGTKPAVMTAQQAIMALVAEKEVYTYFHGAETIEEGRLYSIKTTSSVPATPSSTMHMHVQQDLVYWIWYPEDLANAVPNEVAWGRVKYTGWRWKPFGWFPEVKDVEAIPLSELSADHPAKSGNYFLSDQIVKDAAAEGTALLGTEF